ncbi:hypothetical protein LUW76_25370 [Actinomadura madurae]|uniref:hypothetical protein n=1 Tax=Actinomadura madurae TaxID=1993 RepID=UPI002026FB9C|nr:hypothetical protein [Actinomadura madurae]URM97416.1 hypothetical protein LUW76_25370 [Actinomadura madurae]
MNRLLKAATHGPLARRLTRTKAQSRRTTSREDPTPKPLLAHAFSYPKGAGLIGPGAKPLLRAILVDAMTRRDRAIEVIVAESDLDELLGGVPRELLTAPGSVLHVSQTLEDTIERLESSTTGTAEQPLTLWVATPGADADVIHQTLEARSESSLIGLLNGPWPYGPTHYIDVDGPRQLPTQELKLLSCAQAIAVLQAHRTTL